MTLCLISISIPNSNNRLIEKELSWKLAMILQEVLEKAYPWIREQVIKAKNEEAPTRI